MLNRVFDSSGPEGKVRGTPQQIIDKYNQLARDAQLSTTALLRETFSSTLSTIPSFLLMLKKSKRRDVNNKRKIIKAEMLIEKRAEKMGQIYGGNVGLGKDSNALQA